MGTWPPYLGSIPGSSVGVGTAVGVGVKVGCGGGGVGVAVGRGVSPGANVAVGGGGTGVSAGGAGTGVSVGAAGTGVLVGTAVGSSPPQAMAAMRTSANGTASHKNGFLNLMGRHRVSSLAACLTILVRFVVCRIGCGRTSQKFRRKLAQRPWACQRKIAVRIDRLKGRAAH